MANNDINALTDIKYIKLDVQTSIEDRINSLFILSNNPYQFKCRGKTVLFSFLDTEKTIDDLLAENIARNS